MLPMTDIQETIREIKKDFRLSMNGVVSTLQRRQGLDYKINFGIEFPRLKAIAEKYPQNRELALTLWKDDIRECKILAIYLLPQDAYSSIAEQWIADTKYNEIADRLAMHILCKIPEATNKALEWTSIKDGMFSYCGYMTLSHLFRNGLRLNEKEEELFFGNVAKTITSYKGTTIQRCVLNTLLRYIEENGRKERFETTAKENGWNIPSGLIV